MNRINAKAVRYIRLGRGSAWAPRALAAGEMPFGDPRDLHDLAVAGDWEALAQHYRAVKPTSLAKARDFAREVREFYSQQADCLWITFSDGKLWWGFAEPDVIWPVGDGVAYGDRIRLIRGGWSCTDVSGKLLRMTDLSTRLTKVASYQQTICEVHEREYLLRRLSGETEPSVARALKAKAELVTAAVDLIALLHQADFELLADLIFARSGWRRVSVLGKNQADLDLALEQPTTGERIFVQVKSAATQKVLDDYVDRFDADGTYDRFFFLCHSPKGQLHARGRQHVHVWVGDVLADAAINAGLIDWLL
jgi:hypothetical protein